MQSSAQLYLVDDDTESLRWLDDLVLRWGVKVSRYLSAEQFLKAVGPDERGVVVAEADLPGMNGLELHRELANRGYRLPMMVVARNGGVPVAVQAVRAGVEDFQEKPVVPQLLLRRIRATLTGPHVRETG